MGIADCYGDDLLGILGFPTLNLIDYSPAQASAYLSAWTVLIALQIWCLLWLWRSAGARGGFRMVGFTLIACSSALMAMNHTIRLWVTVLRPAHQLLDTPAWFFVESYAERLVIYALLSASAVLGSIMVHRSHHNGRARVSLICMLIPSAVVCSSLAWSGIGTLSESGYWNGKSITHGQVYMGSIPRSLALTFEPYVTYSFLIALGFFSGLLSTRHSKLAWSAPLVVLFLVIFIQALPKVDRGLLTEAMSTMDFHYTFHHDRSITFPCLPVMVLLSTWFALQTLGSGEPQQEDLRQLPR